MTLGMHWYVVRVPSGREEKVAERLRQRVKSAGIEERVPQVIVPVERITEVKEGSKRIVSRKIYPGYIMLEAELGEQSSAEELDKTVWFTLHETQGFGDFVGGRDNPTPMSDAEVQDIQQRMAASEENPRPAIKMRRGDSVQIKEGPFVGFEGVVEDVNEDKNMVRVSVTIFGRATSVEIQYWHVEPL